MTSRLPRSSPTPADPLGNFSSGTSEPRTIGDLSEGLSHDQILSPRQLSHSGRLGSRSTYFSAGMNHDEPPLKTEPISGATSSQSPNPASFHLAESDYDCLFEIIGEGLAVVEILWNENGTAVDCRLLKANLTFENLTGWHHLTGQTVRQTSPNLEATWLDAFGRVARTGEPLRLTLSSLAMGRCFDVHASALGEGSKRSVAIALRDVTAHQEVEDRQRFLGALDEAVRPLSEASDIVATSARLLGEYLRADRCAYADVEDDQDTFHLTGDYTRGVHSIVGRYTFTEFGSEVLRLMRAELPFVVDDIETHQPPPQDLSAYHATLIRAVICVPLHKSGRFVAAMAVHQRTARKWTPEEIALTLLVANRCWEALQRAKVTRGLQKSEARFRQIADVMPQIVWLARPDGTPDYYNRRWYEFTGRREGDDGDSSWLHLLHPDDLEPCRRRWEHSLRTGEPYESRYRWRDRQTGNYGWFLGRALPLREENGEIERWYGTSTDIDYLVRAEEDARQARADAEAATRAKDDFLAALSHELRTPLTPVLMAAEEMCDDPTLPAAHRESLNMMRRNIALEARLIDDLLDVTRIANGKLAMQMEDCEIHSLLGLCVEIVRDDAQTKGIGLHLDLQAARSHLSGDPARLQQVFWNVLKNAIKFTPDGGRITIRTRDDEESLVVEVHDSGVGITPAALPRIFLPFEQAEHSHSHRFGGLGLGLAIAKAIVERHGGTIAAQSPGRGLGATFRVRLPSMEPASSPAPSAPAPETAPAETKTRPLSLLLVEDHEATLAVLARLLTRAGHDVYPAATAAEAKKLAARFRLEAVVSDIGLPDATGIELMEFLHATYGLRGIALSGYGRDEDLRRTREVGFVAHLVKPVDFALLRQALAALAKPTPSHPASEI